VAIYHTRKPPHLSAEARRRYASILSLSETHPKRRTLLHFFWWWLHYVGFDMHGLDVQWTSPKKKIAITLSGTTYELLTHGINLFDAWVNKSEKSAMTVERDVLSFVQAAKHRLTIARRLADEATDIPDIIRQTEVILDQIAFTITDTRSHRPAIRRNRGRA
jgi:hypothetical protein